MFKASQTIRMKILFILIPRVDCFRLFFASEDRETVCILDNTSSNVSLVI